LFPSAACSSFFLFNSFKACRVSSLECEQLSLCFTLITTTDVCPCPSSPLLFPSFLPPCPPLLRPFSHYSALRPPPHRDYLNGYPGIPASDPSKDPPPSRDPLFQLPHLVSLSIGSSVALHRLSFRDGLTVTTSSALIWNGRDSFPYERSRTQSEMVITRTRKDRDDPTSNYEWFSSPTRLEGQEQERRKVRRIDRDGS